MTEAAELVESIVVVPAKENITALFTLEPTGADQVWILKDASGTEVDTIRVQFQGVKNGGVGQSGKATLQVTLVNTDLVFAKLNGNIDGLETYDDVNDGIDAIQGSKVDSQNAKVLEIDLKANKQTPNSFSFKWVAEDTSGSEVKSADPQTQIDPE